MIFIFVGPRCIGGHRLLPGTYLWIMQVYIANVVPWIAKVILTCSIPFVLSILSLQTREYLLNILEEQQRQYESPMCGLSSQEMELLIELKYFPQEQAFQGPFDSSLLRNYQNRRPFNEEEVDLGMFLCKPFIKITVGIKINIGYIPNRFD